MPAAEHRPAGDVPPDPDDIEEWDPYSEEHAADARKLCLLLSGHNVECAVTGYGGSHDFTSAGKHSARLCRGWRAEWDTRRAAATAARGAVAVAVRRR